MLCIYEIIRTAVISMFLVLITGVQSAELAFVIMLHTEMNIS